MTTPSQLRTDLTSTTGTIQDVLEGSFWLAANAGAHSVVVTSSRDRRSLSIGFDGKLETVSIFGEDTPGDQQTIQSASAAFFNQDLIELVNINAPGWQCNVNPATDAPGTQIAVDENQQNEDTTLTFTLREAADEQTLWYAVRDARARFPFLLAFNKNIIEPLFHNHHLAFETRHGSVEWSEDTQARNKTGSNPNITVLWNHKPVLGLEFQQALEQCRSSARPLRNLITDGRLVLELANESVFRVFTGKGAETERQLACGEIITSLEQTILEHFKQHTQNWGEQALQPMPPLIPSTYPNSTRTWNTNLFQAALKALEWHPCPIPDYEQLTFNYGYESFDCSLPIATHWARKPLRVSEARTAHSINLMQQLGLTTELATWDLTGQGVKVIRHPTVSSHAEIQLVTSLRLENGLELPFWLGDDECATFLVGDFEASKRWIQEPNVLLHLVYCTYEHGNQTSVQGWLDDNESLILERASDALNTELAKDYGTEADVAEFTRITTLREMIDDLIGAAKTLDDMPVDAQFKNAIDALKAQTNSTTGLIRLELQNILVEETLPSVPAKYYDDARTRTVHFDAAPYFQSMSLEALLEFIKSNAYLDDQTDEIAETSADWNPEILEHMRNKPERQFNGDTNGSECRYDRGALLRLARQLHPDQDWSSEDGESADDQEGDSADDHNWNSDD